MLSFSPLHLVKDRRIHIPLHIRAALGLHGGTELYLSTTRCATSALENEIIASPVPLPARDDLWRLRAAFTDRPGILARLFALLSDEKLDVVSCRSQTLEQNTILSVELHFYASFYSHKDDAAIYLRESAAGPTLHHLRSRILAEFIEELDFPYEVKPLLSLRRNLPLYRSQQLVEEREQATLRTSGIQISQDLDTRIYSCYLEQYPNVRSLRGTRRLPLSVVVGDSESSLLRILLLYRNTGHLHLRVRAANRPGCLARVTELLRARGFNILQLYTRLLGTRKQLLSDFLLHLPFSLDKKKSDHSLRKHVEGMTREPSLKGLDVEIIFPTPAADDAPEFT